MIRVADFIAQCLVEHGLRQVFMVTGGGAMHLNDALGHHPELNCLFNHHEQAGAMAAEGYARVAGRAAVVNVTTGPGGINALNGVFGAWTDSIPMLVLSGQVKRETCMASYSLPGLRQLGDQEADILAMARGITKYARLVDDPQTIRYHLERAIFLAHAGRPGPCWLDIPIDVQGAMVDPDSLPAYDAEEDQPRWSRERVRGQCREVVARIQAAKRPVILAGSGVRHAHAIEAFESVAVKLGIPVTTAWTHDLIPSDHPLYCGRPGTIGGRAGNFAVQNADLLLTIGSRLNIRQVSYNWKSFARHAYKVQVDVDPAELAKPTVRPDLPIHCDAQAFLEELAAELARVDYTPEQHGPWLSWCRERLARYPATLPHQRSDGERINPYHFVETLWELLADDDVVVCGNASACIVPFQVAHIRRGQRLFSNSGAASMGHDLPAAIGAAMARGGKRVVCLAGDGSLQMNVQELQTLAHHRLPIKLFVLNNRGYLSIRLTQSGFFGRHVGEGPDNGVSFPDVVKLGEAYGIPSLRIGGGHFRPRVADALGREGPLLCEVMLDDAQPFEPRISSKRLPDGRIVSSPLEEMFPFLEREELLDNLLIPPDEG